MKLIANTKEIAQFLGLTIQGNVAIQDFQIDSRKIKQNSVFLGLKGANEDGGIYYDQALKKGAALVIIKDTIELKAKSLDQKIIRVKSPEKTLIKIAEQALNKFKEPIIGITGSNGKTTTKNILNSGIKNSFATFQNFNNEIGLPLSALALDSKNTIAIFEMGAAKKGDIRFLSKIIQPNIGIITHIGHSHLTGLHSLKGVLDVKSELVTQVRASGAAILPYGEYVAHWKKMRDDIKFYTFGFASSASFFASNIKVNEKGTNFLIQSEYLNNSLKISTPLLGNHNVLNILAAFAAIYESQSDIDFFVKSLKNFQNSEHRLQLGKWINQSTLIDDSYNANPDSVRAAIDVLSQLKDRKVVILGDMLELGRYQKKLHMEIGEYAKMHGVDLLIGLGDLTRHSVSSFGPNGFFFKVKSDLIKFLKTEISKKDNILLKGSRGMKMEELLRIGKNDD